MAWDLSNMNISDDSTSESASSGAIYSSQAVSNPRMTRPLHPHPAPLPATAAASVNQNSAQEQQQQQKLDEQDQQMGAQISTSADRRPTVTNSIYETASSMGPTPASDMTVETSVAGSVSPTSRAMSPSTSIHGMAAAAASAKATNAPTSASLQGAIHAGTMPMDVPLSPTQQQAAMAAAAAAAAQLHQPTTRSNKSSHYGSTRPQSGATSRSGARSRDPNEVIYEAAPAPSSLLGSLNGKTALLLTGGNGYKRISPINNPFLSEHAHCIIWEYKL